MGAFAVTALVVAVLIADRLGPPGELRRRFYQLGFGTILALLVVATSAVVIPQPEEFGGAFVNLDSDERVAHLLRERLTLIVGAGVLILLASLYLSDAWPTISVGGMFAGLTLLFGAALDTSSGGFLAFYYEVLLDGGDVRNGVYAATVAIGLFLMFMYGHRKWERPEQASVAS